nr:unnamed protein product [Spirometra erinaceieuropaei]
MSVSYVDDISDGSGFFILFKLLARLFKIIVNYCDGISGQLPVSFVLGFFVSGVIGRWFHTYMYIPWLNAVTYSVMVT